jgi:hypothetical protein
MRRTIRTSFHVILTIAGMLAILWAVMGADTVLQRILWALAGVVLMEAGIWRITQSIFPDERSFRPLRQETDYFITLVRQLNRAAVAAGRGADGAEQELARVHDEMLHSVDRMRQLAGQTEAQLGYRHPPLQPVTQELQASRAD